MSVTYSPGEKEIMIYYGSTAFIVGVVGGILSTLVFVSLRTFRQSSCAFYLTIISIVNTGQLFTGLLSRILNILLDTDGTETSLFYCKFRGFLFQACIGMSMTCLCFAIVDQYCATCTRPRWQLFCNIKLAQRLVFISFILWILHGIPYLIYYNHVFSTSTNKTTCTSTNRIFSEYRATGIIIVLIGYLPVGISMIFGILAYRNVQQMVYRAVPMVRRELDKQLTVMVLVQVTVGVVTIIPYTTLTGITSNANIVYDPSGKAQLQYVQSIGLLVYYSYFAVSIIFLYEYSVIEKTIFLERILYLYVCI